MKWSHDELRGVVELDGVVVAFTSPQGWRSALTHPTGDDVIRAVRTAIWRMPNNVTAEELRRSAADELTLLRS